jgi:hypothetical protein
MRELKWRELTNPIGEIPAAPSIDEARGDGGFLINCSERTIGRSGDRVESSSMGESSALVVQRWTKYGHDRLYITAPDGTRAG